MICRTIKFWMWLLQRDWEQPQKGKRFQKAAQQVCVEKTMTRII